VRRVAYLNREVAIATKRVRDANLYLTIKNRSLLRHQHHEPDVLRFRMWGLRLVGDN
jgi:hypothetical protein